MSRFVILVWIVLMLSACGDETTNTTCNYCTVVMGPGEAASAPGMPAPEPEPVPLAVPQTDGLPYITICAGCLQWSSGGMSYALIFRDLSGAAQIAMIVQCGKADCTPGPSVWVVAGMLNSVIDLDFISMKVDANTPNAVLLDYGKTKIFPKIAAWFSANSGNLRNGFRFSSGSTLSVSETGDPFARLTALVNKHVVVNPDATVEWREAE